MKMGLPLHAQGIRATTLEEWSIPGITPACAGNTLKKIFKISILLS